MPDGRKARPNPFRRNTLLGIVGSCTPGWAKCVKLCQESVRHGPRHRHDSDSRRAPKQLFNRFCELVPLVRAEEGCIDYGPAIDVDTPIASKPARADVVTVVEKWESVSALQAHLAAPHMKQFRDRVKEIALGVEIQVLAPQ
jgi:quinol monooxygenase YgiN